MNETVKINALEIENVKRIKAVKLTPTLQGMTIIGGNNNQGKTSVLDTIAWALGGDRFRPSNPQRDGSVLPPNIRVTLSNGLLVERSGKNSTLKVTDPTGQKSGQQLLNTFVEELALNLPKFMSYNNREKADVLLQIIGLKEELTRLEQEEKELYNQRYAIGRIADQKGKFAKEMPFYPEAPEDLISITDLIQRQQAILARNGENQKLRQKTAELERRRTLLTQQRESLQGELEQVFKQLNETEELLQIARKDSADLQDESTEALENDIANIEKINIMVRSNLDREKAEAEAEQYRTQYDALSTRIDAARKAKYELLGGAKLPLEGLAVEDGELTYQGRKWDGMSGSEQLKISTAIVRALNPRCGFVLLDKLEQMDKNTLQEFGQWLEKEGLQAIATRVSTGDECSIIIEDGMAGPSYRQQEEPEKKWTAGVF